MIVFKNYFKLLRNAYLTIFIFLAITIFMTVIFTMQTPPQEEFQTMTPIITVINNDDGEIAAGLVDFLSEKAQLKDLAEDEIKDELFFAEIAAAVVIKEGFSEQLKKGKEPKIQIIQSPERVSAINIGLLVNKYLNLASLYLQTDLEAAEIVALLEEDLAEEVAIDFQKDEEEITALDKTTVYFNFVGYGLLAAIIGSVAFIMRSYYDINIRMRSACAPISRARYNQQIIMGNIVLATFLWFIFILVAYLFFGNLLFSLNASLMIIQAFVYAQVALAIAYAIGIFVKSSEVQNGLATVVPLALAFLGGAFVPQFILGENVLRVAQFTPLYWYVRLNDMLSESGINSNIWQEFYLTIMILLLFMVIIYGIVFFLQRKYLQFIN